MSPAEFVAWATAAGVALGTGIKAGDWMLSNMAKRAVERRADLTTVIAEQAALIKDLRAEVDQERQDCEGRIDRLELRVQQAERDRAQMEGVLYRMGWEKNPAGRWQRNPDGGTAT